MILNLIQFQASHFDLKSVGSSLLTPQSCVNWRLKVRRAGDNTALITIKLFLFWSLIYTTLTLLFSKCKVWESEKCIFFTLILTCDVTITISEKDAVGAEFKSSSVYIYLNSQYLYCIYTGPLIELCSTLARSLIWLQSNCITISLQLRYNQLHFHQRISCCLH